MATSENGRVGAYQRLSALPAFHPAAMKLLAISDESESAMSDFEEIFKADLALTANLLLVANSAAFGVQRQINTIRHALTLLGLERVRALACHIMLASYVQHQPDDAIRPIWSHSIATAVVSEILGGIYNVPGMYTVGLMHDLGRLGLLMSVGQRYREAMAKEVGDLNEAIKLEAALCGMDHCDAGAMLAHTWGLPEMLQVAMVEHHGNLPINSKNRIALVQTACRIADWLGFPEVKCTDPGLPPRLPEHIVASGQLDSARVIDLINKHTTSLGF